MQSTTNRTALALLLMVGAIAGVVGVLTTRDDDREELVATTPTSIETSTSTQTPTTSATRSPVTGTAMVVALEGILGWWDGTAWVGPTDGVPVPVVGGEQYQIVRLDDAITTAVGTAPEHDCELSDVPGIDVGLAYPDDWRDPSPIAVSGVRDPRPRPVERLNPQAEVYRAAATDVLAGLGIADSEPAVVQVVRSDLEGDGVDEVLVVTERLSDPETLFAEPGDYSVSFLRQVVAGSVRTTVLAESIAPDPPPEGSTSFVELFRVAALADLNGDGAMEVVVDSTYYEGSGTAAFALTAEGDLVEVLSVGCGA